MMTKTRELHAQLNQPHQLTCLQAAEALLGRDGDFLVRDSSSTQGDYVLSCFSKNGPLHFKIIRVVLRPKKVRLVCCVSSTTTWEVKY